MKWLFIIVLFFFFSCENGVIKPEEIKNSLVGVWVNKGFIDNTNPLNLAARYTNKYVGVEITEDLKFNILDIETSTGRLVQRQYQGKIIRIKKDLMFIEKAFSEWGGIEKHHIRFSRNENSLVLSNAESEGSRYFPDYYAGSYTALKLGNLVTLPIKAECCYEYNGKNKDETKYIFTKRNSSIGFCPTAYAYKEKSRLIIKCESESRYDEITIKIDDFKTDGTYSAFLEYPIIVDMKNFEKSFSGSTESPIIAEKNTYSNSNCTIKILPESNDRRLIGTFTAKFIGWRDGDFIENGKFDIPILK